MTCLDHTKPALSQWYGASGTTARRRALSRTDCLRWLQGGTVGRLAMTAGALPHIAVVRYYLIGETVFIDIGSSEVARSIAGQVVAFESGTSDTDRQHRVWSVCAVGVVSRSVESPEEEIILEMHPQLLSGWVDTLIEQKDEASFQQAETTSSD